MHAENAGGAGRDERFDFGGINIVCRGIDVAKDRRDFLPLEGMRGGDKGERRHDDFATETERAGDEAKGDGGIAHRDAMFHPEQITDAAFEFLDVGAAVGEPLIIENVVYSMEETVAIAEVRPAHVQGVREFRRQMRERERVRLIHS